MRLDGGEQNEKVSTSLPPIIGLLRSFDAFTLNLISNLITLKRLSNGRVNLEVSDTTPSGNLENLVSRETEVKSLTQRDVFKRSVFSPFALFFFLLLRNYC